MSPIETTKGGSEGLGQESLSQIATRLREVRRRCAGDPGMVNRRNKAVEALDAILADLEQALESSSDSILAGDLDFRLALVEELFEASGSHGLGRVVANIRNTLRSTTENSTREKEPPPPRRFQPSPASAVRQPRPRPGQRDRRVPEAAPARKGFFGRLILTILMGTAIALASVAYFQSADPEPPLLEPTDREVINEPVAVPTPVPSAPTAVPPRSQVEDDFDSDEEEMVQFTLEIRLAESTLNDGDVSESLRHFAAAAAIDRHHRRLKGMGRSLIAALLREADLAYDSGDFEAAGKKVQSARGIARGLRLDDSAIDHTAKKLAAMTRFEDITPNDAEALRDAIGRPVRLTLKTRDVIVGHLLEINDGILLLDVYSGVKGGEVEFSTSILASTIREIRVYDAQDPAEIMVGD